MKSLGLVVLFMPFFLSALQIDHLYSSFPSNYSESNPLHLYYQLYKQPETVQYDSIQETVGGAAFLFGVLGGLYIGCRFSLRKVRAILENYKKQMEENKETKRVQTRDQALNRHKNRRSTLILDGWWQQQRIMSPLAILQAIEQEQLEEYWRVFLVVKKESDVMMNKKINGQVLSEPHDFMHKNDFVYFVREIQEVDLQSSDWHYSVFPLSFFAGKKLVQKGDQEELEETEVCKWPKEPMNILRGYLHLLAQASSEATGVDSIGYKS